MWMLDWIENRQEKRNGYIEFSKYHLREKADQEGRESSPG